MSISKTSILSLFACLLLLTACSTTNKPEKYRGISKNTASAVKPNTTAADYNVQLGMGYLEQGDVSRAKQKFLLAKEQGPQYSPAQQAMGYFYESTEEPKNAEKYYLKAIQLDPKSGSAHNNYGTFLCKQQRFKEADQQFMLAVQDPAYLKTAEAYENAGLCAMQIPDNAKASDYFQKAIAKDTKRSTAYLELAQISYNQKQYDQAQKYLAQYQAQVKELEPEALWLAIRLAREQKDQVSAGRYSMLLQNRYPDSKEYKELRASQATNVKQPTEPKLELPLFKALSK